MKRKMLSGLLILSMVTMLFTGCGKEEPVTNEVEENAQVEEQEVEEPEVIETEITEVEEVESDTTEEAYPDDMVIEFKDEKLLAHIRNQISKSEGDITYGDIKRISNVRFSESGYTDLSPLIYFTDLEGLIFEYCDDISFVSTMPANHPKFYYVSLYSCENISSLSSITDIKELGVYQCNENLSFIENLTNLEKLTIQENSFIKDVSFLSSCTKIEKLSIDLCFYLEDISALSNLSNLEELTIIEYDGNISDISCLTNLSNLKILHLNCKYVEDITALSNLTNLETLYITAYSPKTSVSWSGLTKLTTVTSSSFDIGYLDGAPSIKDLTLNCHEIEDISAVGTLDNLEKLTLDACEYIQDINPVANCINLKEFSASYVTVLSDISALSGLTNLEKLTIQNSRTLKDISAISNLTNLKEIWIGGCFEIEDISALANLTNLEELFIGRNDGEDVSLDNMNEFLN